MIEQVRLFRPTCSLQIDEEYRLLQAYMLLTSHGRRIQASRARIIPRHPSPQLWGIKRPIRGLHFSMANLMARKVDSNPVYFEYLAFLDLIPTDTT